MEYYKVKYRAIIKNDKMIYSKDFATLKELYEHIENKLTEVIKIYCF